MSGTLDMWVVYERPRDYPEGFVVRRWRVAPGERERPDAVALYLPTLETARAQVPAGLVRLARWPGDDPAICEVWL